MRRIFRASLAFSLFMLASCGTPADISYCERMGITPNHGEYQNCIAYFNRQQAWFSSDRSVCSAEADRTYPPSLYDRGSYGIMRGGYGSGFYGPGYGVGMGHGGFYGSRMVDIPPDYARNAELDNLRMRIIEPCMQAKGWKSGSTWEAGRFDGKQAMPAPIFTPKPPAYDPAVPAKTLPWLNK